jgi:tripartite-type tricarboxylate transporter receptor subunit TctC
MFTLALTLAPMLGSIMAPLSARADEIEDFYRGRNLIVMVGVGAGGEYDLQMRLVARHIGKHIPGKPATIAQNMVGATGLLMANYLANVAPKDGSVIALVQNGLPSYQAMGGTAVEFDVRKFGWIGNTTDSPNVLNSWHTTNIKTIEEAMQRELVVGSPGTATTSYIYPSVMNALIGTKFKIVSGYPGGNDVNLAMEKGEVGGRGSNSWASWKSGHAHWIEEKKIHILVQVALKRAPDLPDVPLAQDLAGKPEDRALIDFLLTPQDMGRPFFSPPEVPPERVATLRDAFAKTLKDPDFMREADKAGIEVQFTSGEDVHKLLERIHKSPPQLIERAISVLR